MKKSNKLIFLLFSFLLFSLISCGSTTDNDAPGENINVTLSMKVGEITGHEINCSIEVKAAGTEHLSVQEKGICYSLQAANPTVSDEKVVYSGSGKSDFSSFAMKLEGLAENTSYYVRAFISLGGDKVYYGYAQQIKTLGVGKDYYPLGKDEDITEYTGYQLVWSDEFNIDGKPGNDWSYESGFVRNEELQWYQDKNASVSNGCLVIEGRKERVVNPNYQAGSGDWKINRNVAEYTSSSLTTQNSHTFKYGRFEIRAKLPFAEGSWPAIWTLGNTWDWPMNGEIDIMECYLVNGKRNILANACWSSPQQWVAVWNRSTTLLTHFIDRDADWMNKYHVWRMDWDASKICIYLDGELLNEINSSETQNQGWNGNTENPFSNDIDGFGHYILLNLAIGGNGGDPSNSLFPMRYEVDYVRVYQKK